MVSLFVMASRMVLSSIWNGLPSFKMNVPFYHRLLHLDVIRGIAIFPAGG
jgi:hypothetical protein